MNRLQRMAPRDYLDSRFLHGMKLGLDNIRFLAEAAGHPELSYPTVHIAGTNGKGSVVATLASILRAAGYRVGQYTSPHLIRLNERFLVDGVPIDDEALDTHIDFYQDLALSNGHADEFSPTYFEIATAVAFRHFAERSVDVGIFEVGLGGRFDSTNVILPEACAITTIDLEHTKYLGDTLGKIAFEKAGILKEAVPAVVGETRAEPRDVILTRAADLQCPVLLRGRDFTHDASGSPFSQTMGYQGFSLTIPPAPLGLNGRHQAENAAVAVALAETLRDRFVRIDAESIKQGLRDVRWPCRLEKVLESPPVILDATHTPAGAARLVGQIPKCLVVLALCKDKDAAAIVRALEPVTARLIVSEFEGKRHLPAEDLRAAAETAGVAGRVPVHVAPTLTDAIAMGMEHADANTPLLVTGGVFTSGEARAILSQGYGAPGLPF